MRHTEKTTISVGKVKYDVSQKIGREIEDMLRNAAIEALRREKDDWIPIEDVYPDINHPVRGPANYLRGIRSREGLTQTQLAKKTGIKQSHISEMERYKRVIGKATAKKLASALNCNWRSMVSE